jgi:serine/threonine protein kinase
VTEAVQRLSSALADRYRIERELGAGGMATVYLARDIRHDRNVALKVLRPELSAILGAERFLQEIRTTANLQHPHILSLYDSGEAEGLVFYVMPYVEGESLRDRLRREHQLPVEDAVRIAGEVLGALDYAHRHGVVHRDIKPENILLHDGSALVADFGIALAVSRSEGGTRMTETGMSLGTPHYMAPEQAMGEREITPRADVYALGCVLYEMLVGEPPFTGPTAQAIVARVMTEAPRALTIQRHTIPPHVEAAVQAALEKLPADRFATAAQFAEALAKPGSQLLATRTSPAAARPPRGSRLVAPLAVAAAAAAGLAAWALLRPLPPTPVIRYVLQLPESQAAIPTRRFALSPNGEWLAYVGPGSPNQIWLRHRSRIDAVPLAGTAVATSFDFSPDGEWLAFVQRGALLKVPVIGGAAITLSDSVSTVQGAVAWLEDGTIAFIRSSGFGVWRIPENGGNRTLAWRPDTVPAATISYLAAIPGGRGVLVTRCPRQPCRAEERGLWAADLHRGTATLVQAGVTAGAYIPTGHVLYVRRDGAMLAMPFDPGRLEPTGAPIPLLDSISVVNEVAPLFAVAGNGTMALRFGGSAVERNEYTMVWVDRSGREAVVDSAFTFRHAAAGSNAGWSLSPDGRRVAVGINTEAGDDIWVKELPRGPLSRVTFDSLPDLRPRWTRDGQNLLYVILQLRIGAHRARRRRARRLDCARPGAQHVGSDRHAYRTPRRQDRWDGRKRRGPPDMDLAARR